MYVMHLLLVCYPPPVKVRHNKGFCLKIKGKDVTIVGRIYVKSGALFNFLIPTEFQVNCV